MTDLINGQLGPETKYEVDLENGALIAHINFSGSQLGADFKVKLDAVAILHVLKAKIPGTIDDVVINLVIAALGQQQTSKV